MLSGKAFLILNPLHLQPLNPTTLHPNPCTLITPTGGKCDAGAVKRDLYDDRHIVKGVSKTGQRLGHTRDGFLDTLLGRWTH